MLQKVDAFSFKYQDMDCHYTFFKYQLSEKRFVKSGEMLDNVPKVVYFDQRTKGEDKTPSIAEYTLEKLVLEAITDLLQKEKINTNW